MKLPKTQQILVDRMKAENLMIQMFFGNKRTSCTLVDTDTKNVVKGSLLNNATVQGLVDKKIVVLHEMDHKTGITKHYYKLA